VLTAVILVKSTREALTNLGPKLADVPGVSEATAVTGPYDVIVRAEARDIDELGRLVVSELQALGGVARTMTCPIIHL